MATASGTFKITSFHEDAYHEAGGEPKLTRAGGEQTFTGDIEGVGIVEWLMCYSADGSARFVGLQRIQGTIGVRRGSFVVESSGDHDGQQSKGIWRVVEDSGTGDLLGIRGEGGFHAPGGPEVTYQLEYELAK
jgi:hypothetical protein